MERLKMNKKSLALFGANGFILLCLIIILKISNVIAGLWLFMGLTIATVIIRICFREAKMLARTLELWALGILVVGCYYYFSMNGFGWMAPVLLFLFAFLYYAFLYMTSE